MEIWIVSAAHPYGRLETPKAFTRRQDAKQEYERLLHLLNELYRDASGECFWSASLTRCELVPSRKEE